MLGNLTEPITLVNPNPIQPVPMPGTTTTTTATKPTLADQVSKWLGIGKEAAEIYQTVRNPQTGTQQWPAPAPNTTTYTPPPAAASNNTLKYVLIGGAVLAVGFGVYAIAKSK